MSSKKIVAKAKDNKEAKKVQDFYAWLQRAGNVYMADVERMDRAILIVTANV